MNDRPLEFSDIYMRLLFGIGAIVKSATAKELVEWDIASPSAVSQDRGPRLPDETAWEYCERLRLLNDEMNLRIPAVRAVRAYIGDNPSPQTISGAVQLLTQLLDGEIDPVEARMALLADPNQPGTPS